MNVFFGSVIVLFVFTLIFSYMYKVIRPLMKMYTYIKCLTGGFIIGIILLEVLRDIYSTESILPSIVTGVSFYVLFMISKLYIERVESKEQDSIPTGASKKEALIFILALSLHSFMEGLGMGSKTGSKFNWYVISILVHKWLEAIVLGASVLSAGFSDLTNFILLLMYSSLTSIGAIIGKTVNTGNTNVVGVLDGIAAGSFFYIGFVEMVGNEFVVTDQKYSKSKLYKKILAMLIGYLSITTVLSMAKFIEEHA
ncbi:solute carrier family 39 (zinc transporter), member 1/2/3 [Nematocida sp. AWRm80]|nr:solute carrier family 39 (zinc transporter), member 1/2/3 [Nematocida sp. AWRm80]